MQNIDFSSQIRKNKGAISGFSNEGAKKSPQAKTSSKPFSFSNRWISFSFSILLIIFSIGFYVGLRVGTIKQIEKSDCIVRYPDSSDSKKTAMNQITTPGHVNTNNSSNDNNNSTSTSLANTGTGTNLTYIIKAGSFKQAGALKLTQQLNNVSEIRKLKPLACKGVKEMEPDRGVAFRMIDNKNKDNEIVLIGCFQTASRASHVLDIVRKSGLPGSSNAELYEY